MSMPNEYRDRAIGKTGGMSVEVRTWTSEDGYRSPYFVFSGNGMPQVQCNGMEVMDMAMQSFHNQKKWHICDAVLIVTKYAEFPRDNEVEVVLIHHGIDPSLETNKFDWMFEKPGI